MVAASKVLLAGHTTINVGHSCVQRVTHFFLTVALWLLVVSCISFQCVRVKLRGVNWAFPISEEEGLRKKLRKIKNQQLTQQDTNFNTFPGLSMRWHVLFLPVWIDVSKRILTGC